MAAAKKSKLILKRGKRPVYVKKVGGLYFLLPPELKDIPGAERINPCPTKANPAGRDNSKLNVNMLNALKYALPYLMHSVKFYRYQHAGKEFWPNREELEGIITDVRAAIAEAAGSTGEKAANPSPVERASRLSKKFHGAAPRIVKHIDFRSPKCLALIGSCAQLDYISDKWDGKRRQYYHKFEKPCLVMADPDPQPDGSRLIVILGKFKITERGIIG